MAKDILKLAFVTPWYGRDLVGGAELYCYHLTQTLVDIGHSVDVLTTCCKSFKDPWDKNFYPSGVEYEGLVKVHRFSVDSRNSSRFDQANEELMSFNSQPKPLHKSFYSPASEASFLVDNINSVEMMAYLVSHYNDYDAFLFIPYLYGPVLNGLPLVRNKSYLIPCLHDETYAYLSSTARIFSFARGIFFISEGEAQIARRIFGPSVESKSVVIGGGIEVDLEDKGDQPVEQDLSKFFLYLGRKDDAKNTSNLLEAFDRLVAENPEIDFDLVLAGPGSLNDLSYHVVHHRRIFDLGVVNESVKTWLIRNCRALLQPSLNESFSRVMMEAWAFGRPVVIHSKCLATSAALKKSSGGWEAAEQDEWKNVLARIAASECDTEVQVKGELGRSYVESEINWNKTAICMLDNIYLDDDVSLERRPRFHQILAGFSLGDAISNQALILRKILLALGFHSEIYAVYIDPSAKSLDFIKDFSCFIGESIEGFIYHHSTFFPWLQYLFQKRASRKIMVYHNITPAQFFQNWILPKYRELRSGRDQLKLCKDAFDTVVGDSLYNVRELREIGYINTQVIHLPVDPIRWNAPADDTVLRRFGDNYVNLLFVGRIAPNKCQHDLINLLLEVRRLCPFSRLILVGNYDEWDPYYNYTRNLAEDLGLQEYVHFVGHTTDRELLAYYRVADAFVSMSEHEGFCVPVVEAFEFELPVFAYASEAVVEITQGSCELFEHKRFHEIAQLILSNLENEAQLARQRERLRSFSTDVIVKQWLGLLRHETVILNDWKPETRSQIRSEIRPVEI